MCHTQGTKRTGRLTIKQFLTEHADGSYKLAKNTNYFKAIFAFTKDDLLCQVLNEKVTLFLRSMDDMFLHLEDKACVFINLASLELFSCTLIDSLRKLNKTELLLQKYNQIMYYCLLLSRLLFSLSVKAKSRTRVNKCTQYYSGKKCNLICVTCN